MKRAEREVIRSRVKDWRERREKKKEEEKNKLSRCQIATVIVLHSFFVLHPVSVCL